MSDDEKGPFGPSSYEIGYGKPPKSKRFVKGRSGNPRGRPKKSSPKPHTDPSTRDLFLSETRRSVQIQHGGKLLEIPVVQGVMRSQLNKALKGSALAQKHVLDRHERFSNDLNGEIKEDHEFWRKYAADYEENISSRPEGWIHPEDLIFEDGRPVMVRGGNSPEALRDRELRIRYRDALILQAEKDRRNFRSKKGVVCNEPIFTSELLVQLLNSSLPRRLQLDDLQLILRMDRTRTLKKRELEQRLRKDWADLGISEARNLITPPVNSLLIELGMTLIN